KEILTYARSHKLSFVKDSSNRDPKYWRNRLRLKVIPHLQKEAPHLAREISRMSLKLRDDVDYLNSLAETVYQQQVKRKKGERSFLLAPFQELPPALQVRLLKNALFELEAPVRGISHHLETMLGLIRGEKKNGRYALPSRFFFQKTDGVVRISLLPKAEG
ncbi:MAG: ATP-binding protein, partial [Deltaproteobacteria bacterium]|nr:ATP-binding protein [Deltaproteobacteria bacterium]